MQISANGTRVFYALGLGDALKALSCEPPARKSASGTPARPGSCSTSAQISVERYGFPYFMSTAPTCSTCSWHAVARASPMRIHLDAKCVGFDAGPRDASQRFESGAASTAMSSSAPTACIRAFRQRLFGADQPKFTGIIAWRGIVPMERLPPHMARMVGTNWVGPGGHVVHYPLRARQLHELRRRAASAATGRSNPGARAAPPRSWRADFAGWHEDIHALIRNIAMPYKWALMTRPPMARWTAAASRCWATPATPCCPSWRRAR